MEIYKRVIQGGGETGSLYVVSYQVGWYVHIYANPWISEVSGVGWGYPMSLAPAGTLGWMPWTYRMYPDLISSPPNTTVTLMPSQWRCDVASWNMFCHFFYFSNISYFPIFLFSYFPYLFDYVIHLVATLVKSTALHT